MRLLFITSNRIGDAVLSTGLLSYLLQQHPDAQVTIACGPAAADLFRDIPQVNRVIVMRKGRRAAHWRSLWKQTVTTWWDLVVDLRASAMAWLLPTRRRMIYRPAHNDIHRVRQMGALVGRQDDPPSPRLWLGHWAEVEASQRLPDGTAYFGLGPAANWAGKSWLAERFIHTVQALTGADGILPNAKIVLFGGPDEQQAVQPIRDALPAAQLVDLVGQISLPEVAACLSRCQFYLGNDSGLMHMAAAAGIPTLGLFGPSNQELYAPWGERTAWVRTDRSFYDYINDPNYDFRVTHSLMQDLPTERVIVAAHALWQRCVKRVQ